MIARFACQEPSDTHEIVRRFVTIETCTERIICPNVDEHFRQQWRIRRNVNSISTSSMPICKCSFERKMERWPSLSNLTTSWLLWLCNAQIKRRKLWNSFSLTLSYNEWIGSFASNKVDCMCTRAFTYVSKLLKLPSLKHSCPCLDILVILQCHMKLSRVINFEV